MTRGRGDAETRGRADPKTRGCCDLRVSASPRLLLSGWWREAATKLAAAGIEPEEARLEAEVLLRHVLGFDRAGFLVRRAEDLPEDALARLLPLLERRLAREPLAYIIGHKEFYGLDFLVDRRALIPRPETEGLVERVFALVSAGGPFNRPGYTPAIVDVGTGSGCIAVALAVHLPGARVWATEVSEGALALARESAGRRAVGERITFLQGDLLTPLTHQVDVIVSNPPYIAGEEIDSLPPEIARYEPRAALDGGADGLAVIRRLLTQAPAHLKPGGAVLLEIGAGQGSEVARLAQAALPAATVVVQNDLAGLERYVTIYQGTADDHR